MIIENEKFHPIKNFSNYLVSESGKVYSLFTKRLLTASKNSKDYYFYSMTPDGSIGKSVGRHRLLCEVFKPFDGPTDEMVVNHINGIKGDDRLENLEWVTYKENSEHAGLLGLTSKCLPCTVLDTLTGGVTMFPSAVEASKALGMSKDAILYRLKQSPDRVFPEMKQYRIGHHPTGWYVNNTSAPEADDYGVAKSVSVKNIDTGVVTIYKTLTMAAEAVGHSASNLSKKLGNESQPFFKPNFLAKWTKDKTPWREAKDRYAEYERAANTRPVILVGERDTKRFLTASLCAATLGVNYTTVLYRLGCKDKQFFDGYKFYYYSDYHSVQ